MVKAIDISNLSLNDQTAIDGAIIHPPDSTYLKMPSQVPATPSVESLSLTHNKPALLLWNIGWMFSMRCTPDPPKSSSNDQTTMNRAMVHPPESVHLKKQSQIRTASTIDSPSLADNEPAVTTRNHEPMFPDPMRCTCQPQNLPDTSSHLRGGWDGQDCGACAVCSCLSCAHSWAKWNRYWQ